MARAGFSGFDFARAAWWPYRSNSQLCQRGRAERKATVANPSADKSFPICGATFSLCSKPVAGPRVISAKRAISHGKNPYGVAGDLRVPAGLADRPWAGLLRDSLRAVPASTSRFDGKTRDRAKTIDRGPGPGNDIRTEQARGLPRGRRRRAAIGAAE